MQHCSTRKPCCHRETVALSVTIRPPLNILEPVWSSQLSMYTVPDTRFLDSKASIAIFCPRFRNDQLSCLCRTQVTTASALWHLFRGRIKVTSTIASHSPLNISETVGDRGLVPKDPNRKWSMGNPSHVTMQWRHVTPKGQARDHNTIRVQYLGKTAGNAFQQQSLYY